MIEHFFYLLLYNTTIVYIHVVTFTNSLWLIQYNYFKDVLFKYKQWNVYFDYSRGLYECTERLLQRKKLPNSLMRNTKERILLFKQSTFWEQGGIRTRYRLNPKSTGIFPQCTVELTLYYVKIPAICTCNFGYYLRIKLQLVL